MALLPADLVVENAVVWSGGSLTKSSFVAIRDGRFVYVGKPDSSWIGGDTVRVDAQGKVLLPGFIDSHTHLVQGGVALTQLDLRDADTKAKFLAKIKAWADSKPGKGTIFGYAWSAESWPEKTQPTRWDVDSVTGDRPAVLARMDGHSVLLNSAALKSLKITKDTKSPEGGSVDKDPQTGEPTGLLRESAMSMAAFMQPPRNGQTLADGLRAAVQMANRNGITAVSEICSVGDFQRYVTYGKENPTLRFSLYPRASDWTSEVRAVREFAGVPGWVHANGLKCYMDGTLGSRTAWMLEPFTKPLPDQKSLTGLPQTGFTDGTYAKGIVEATGAGLQTIVHAIGDRANHEILSVFIASSTNTRAVRYRVEHAQHLTAQDIERFGSSGVIASMQPLHKADDGRYCEEVIGTERSKTSYAYRQLLDRKAFLAFGSDWPVVDINPWLGIEAAVTGRTLKGELWMTHQDITLNEALTAYTSTGAYAMKRESDLGQVKVGFRADFQLMQSSPFVEKPDWKTLRAASLYIEGRKVY